MKNKIMKLVSVFALALLIIAQVPKAGAAADYSEIQLADGWVKDGYTFTTQKYEKSTTNSEWLYQSTGSYEYNTALQILQGNGKTLDAFCFAKFKWDQKGAVMSLITIEEYMALYREEYVTNQYQLNGRVPVEVNIDKVRAIAFNSRIAIPLSEIRQRTGISGLTEQEATRAGQFAIWTLTDGLKTRPYKLDKNRFQVYFDAYLNYPDRWRTVDLVSTLTRNETRYYQYLMGLEEMPKPAAQENLLSDLTITYPDENTAVIKYDYLQSIAEPTIKFEGKPDTVYTKDTVTENGRVYVTLTANITQDDKVCVEAIGKDVLDIAIMTGTIQPKVVIVPQKVTKKVCADIVKPIIPETDLQLNKKDNATGALLPGAEFTISDSEGNVLQTAVSDADGKISFTGLKPGAYTIKETAAPEGYQLNPDAIQIEVKNENGNAVVYFNNAAVSEIDVLNQKNLFELNIYKIDGDTRLPVNGAVFELKNAAGEVVGTATSANGGRFKFVDLAPGNYTLTETVTPAPYIAPVGTLIVTINEGGAVSYSGDLARRASVSNNLLTFRNYKRIY